MQVPPIVESLPVDGLVGIVLDADSKRQRDTEYNWTHGMHGAKWEREWKAKRVIQEPDTRLVAPDQRIVVPDFSMVVEDRTGELYQWKDGVRTPCTSDQLK